MKIFVDKDERYPDYYLTEENWGKEIEISSEDYSDYLQVCALYNSWQDKLEELSE